MLNIVGLIAPSYIHTESFFNVFVSVICTTNDGYNEDEVNIR